MSETKHTPTPFFVVREEHTYDVCSSNCTICECEQVEFPGDYLANAEFICLACNCLEELVAALEFVLRDCEEYNNVCESYHAAVSILAKVKDAT